MYDPQMALARVLQNKAVTAPIVGPRTEEYLATTIEALAIELDRDFLDELERLFPGPGVVPESLPGDGYRPGTDTRLLCRLQLV
jgi:hypothetical protein